MKLVVCVKRYIKKFSIGALQAFFFLYLQTTAYFLIFLKNEVRMIILIEFSDEIDCK